MILGFTSWKRFLICAASIIEQLWGKEGLWWSKKTFLNCNSSFPSSFSHLIRLLQKAHFYLMVCKKSLWIKQSLNSLYNLRAIAWWHKGFTFICCFFGETLSVWSKMKSCTPHKIYIGFFGLTNVCTLEMLSKHSDA